MKNVGKLQISTPSDREIAMTRIFDAPRSMVFDAWTKPELLTRWLGVRGGWTFAICQVDLRVGGSYRFVWRGPDGTEMGMVGVYREVVRPERLGVRKVRPVLVRGRGAGYHDLRRAGRPDHGDDHCAIRLSGSP